MHKKIIFFFSPIFICILCITSCDLGFYLRYHHRCAFAKNLQITKFNNEPTNVRELLDIDGYYRCDDNLCPWYNSKNILFYDDGSFSFFQWRDRDDNGKRLFKGNKKQFEDSIVNCRNIDLFETIAPIDTFVSQSILVGGTYNLNNKTIVTDVPCVYNGKWVIGRNYFTIIDKRTFVRERFQLILADTIIQFDSISTFRFFPAHNPPSSNLMFAKRLEWMWKTKEEYKKFKRVRKSEWRKTKYYRNSQVITTFRKMRKTL